MKITANPNYQVEGIYSVELEGRSESLATLNLTPSKTTNVSPLIKHNNKEYRLWDPYKSKLAAAMLKGLPVLPITPGSRVLYLGAATGTTVSHISDILGVDGHVYAVEFAPRSVRELIGKLHHRLNVLPILADARFPWSYKILVEKVDVIYCDIAQPKQAQVLADNVNIFLREAGSALLAIKARSIDSTKKPEQVFKREIDHLKRRQLKVKAVIPLEPYVRDHVMVLAER